MRNNRFLRSVLWLCLAAGCDGSAAVDEDELASQGGELERPEGKPAKPQPPKDEPPPQGAPKPEEPGCGPDGEVNPCAALQCPANSRCEVEQVLCVRAPCPPIARCVPVDVKPNPQPGCAVTLCSPNTQCIETREGPRCVPADVTTCAATLCEVGTVCIDSPTGARCERRDVATCAATLCEVGTICVEEPTGARCVKQDVASCAATLCEVGTTCIESPTGAKCVPNGCRGHKCDPGTHCELEAVQCIRAPCPANPVCVADAERDPCATVRCRAGTHCVAKEVQCVRAPCPPIAECVMNERAAP
jgi:hypothetical protein